MTFNHAQTYTQFLSRLCIKYYIYLKYILDVVSEFNGYHIWSRDDIERGVSLFFFSYFAQVDLILITSDIFRHGIHPMSVLLHI